MICDNGRGTNGGYPSSQVGNEFLTQSFLETEVKEAIFQKKRNSALGSDGFPTEFWNIIKGDLIALFEEFHRGKIPLHKLNFGTIILLPNSSVLNKSNHVMERAVSHCGF